MFDVSTKITLPCVCQSLPVFGYQTNHSVLFDILLLGVWMSDETLFLVFDILLVGVWISDETLFLVFDILLLSVWISDETLFLVFEYLSVFGYQMNHSFSCLIYYFFSVWISY